MSEAIISRKGGKAGIQYMPSVDIFTTNTFYTAYPGNYRVICIGGGGRGGAGNSWTGNSWSVTGSWQTFHYSGGGGGSGYRNDYSFAINNQEVVPITIGARGGFSSSAGGTTSFGSYIAANGGTAGSDAIATITSNGVNGGYGYNNGMKSKGGSTRITNTPGGWLYSDNSIYVNNVPSGTRLYYGEGGNGGTTSNDEAVFGNSGYMVVIYTP